MEVLEAIKSVKSVSKYKPDPVPEQKVQAVVNAARFALSADNIQPWKFIVVSDEDAKRKLAGACTNGKHMADAPLVVVACARLDEAVAMIGGYMNSYPVDVGMALANVTVAATSEGLGTSWIFTFNEEKGKSLLNIPADAHVVGLTPLGIPEAYEAPAGRKHLSEILAYNAYDSATRHPILLEQASMAQRGLTPSKAAYCSECGAETPPDAASCARCGEPFEGSMQAVLCPICNSINPASATECLNSNPKFPEPRFDRVPTPPNQESPEEAYLRRRLQLNREKARSRGAAGGGPGAEPASLLLAGRTEGKMGEGL